MDKKIKLFHGGCHGCNVQKIFGIEYCVGCQCFEANWKLPDLNDEHLSNKLEREVLKLQLIEKLENQGWVLKGIKKEDLTFKTKIFAFEGNWKIQLKQFYRMWLFKIKLVFKVLFNK